MLISLSSTRLLRDLLWIQRESHSYNKKILVLASNIGLVSLATVLKSHISFPYTMFLNSNN